ncbi:MAG: serine hydrolase domain-containing protein [Actinomycetota bacterium]
MAGSRTSPRLGARPLPADVARIVRREMKGTGTPGVAVGILHRGRAYAEGFGVTNVAEPAPVDRETLFQIGSTAKTFTATALMRLVERGEIDLDEPVRRYVKGLKLRDASVARDVTLRHLLTHTGGWAGDLFVDTGRGEDALERAVVAMRKAPQLTPLGRTFHYNNAGFYLAGRVLERVTGTTFEAAIRELLLEPLGMTRSFFFTEELVTRRVATGHVGKGHKQIPQAWWGLRSTAPAGGLVSDAVDQLRWAQFHLGDGRAPSGKRLLKRSTLLDMQRPHADAGALARWVGLSWLLDEVGGVRTVAHGGTTIGQLSTFTMVPAEGLAVTTLTNSTSGRSLNRAIVGHVLRRYAGVRRTQPKPMDVTRAELAAYEGRYVDGFKQVAVELTPVGKSLRGSLRALAGNEKLPTIRLAFVETDRAVHVDDVYTGIRAEFLRNGSGRVAWLRFGGRLYRRLPAGKANKRQGRR